MTTALATVAETHAESALPVLVRRAAEHLAQAETAAEVLEARELARAAYDAGKSAERLAKIRGAHDEVIAAVYRAQADALEIEYRAKRRLADEYDEAKRAGEVAGEGARSTIPAGNSSPTVSELGLSSKEIHEGREASRAEAAKPGITRDIIDLSLSQGRAPTRADTRRAFRETVHGVGQRQAERPAPMGRDTAMVAFVDACRKLEGQLDRVGFEKMADAIMEADPRLAALPVVRGLHDALTKLLEDCDG